MPAMVALVQSDDEDDEGSSGSDASDEENSTNAVLVRQTTHQVKKIKRDAKKQNRLRSAFRSNCCLAASVGIWVAIFGYPMYSLFGYQWTFGLRGPLLGMVLAELNSSHNRTERENQIVMKLRISCDNLETGKMRNIAGPFEEANLVPWNSSDMSPWDVANPNDIWCGYLNGNHLDYWPNVAQLIIFSIFRNTGTTIQLAWQGVIGTFFACINVIFMQLLYPAGAAGHRCVRGSAAIGWLYTVLWHRNGHFHWRLSANLQEAQWAYDSAGWKGGLDARVIFDGNGEEVTGWFLNGELREATMEKYEFLHGENCTEGTMVYDSPGYNEWVCMVDVIVVLFLFLISRSARNTIMFGMSWHVTFMMDFMNPQKGIVDCFTWHCTMTDSTHGAVWRTTLIGAVIAILATLPLSMCLPVSHFRNLREDSLAMTRAVTRIWRESMHYLNGRMRTAKRFQIETMIVNLSNNFTQAQTDADGAWWETLDFGNHGRTRRLLKEYDMQTSDIRDMMNCVRGCVLQEDFKGNHARFTEHMAPVMEKLQAESEELMFTVLVACQDGRVDPKEAEEIMERVDTVKELQGNFLRAFHQASPDVSLDLAEESIFCFALSLGARKMTDFAERIVAKSEHQESWVGLHVRMLKELLKSLWDGVVLTWSPRRMFEKEHLKFCLRNLISISAVFIFSYFVPSGSVFVQYSSIMAGTLTLVIVGDGTHQIGSMIHKNLHRLLGVVLGKVLPIIIMWVYLFFPCLSNARFVIQAFTTWLYVYSFVYIYYASTMWGYVGCLIAGFGVYQLLVPCSADPVGTFKTRYQEIGSVVFAIFVQGVIHTALSRHTPTQLMENAVLQLGQSFQEGYQAFFDCDVPAMQSAAKEIESRLALCKGLLPECDPKMKAVGCGERDFRYELCSQGLRDLDHLLGEFHLLIVAAKDWVANEAVIDEAEEEANSPEGDETAGILETLMGRPAMNSVKEELTNSLTNTMELFQTLVADKDCKDIDSMRAAVELEAAASLYKQLSVTRCGSPMQRTVGQELTNDTRVRLTIAVRALENSEFHLYKVTERCLKDFPV